MTLVKPAAGLLECGGYYCLLPNEYRLPEPELAVCEKLALCLVTLGPKISEEIALCFDRKAYSEGYRLEHWSNEALFNASEELNRRLAVQAGEQGCNLTLPFFPGEGRLGLAYQPLFLAAMKKREDIPVAINEHHVLIPEKSILYVFGVDRRIPRRDIRHDCSRCGREVCSFRRRKAAADNKLG